MKFRTLTIAGAAAAFFTMQAPGAFISINYDTVVSSTPALSPTDSAGVVPAINWNNIASNGPGGFLSPTQTFVDDSASATPLTVGVTSGGADSWNTGGNADQKIYGDWINAGKGTTINLSGIPYASYDLYIYESHYAAGEVVTFTIGGDVQTLTNTAGPFGTPTHRLNDSYVKFTGLTASDVSVAVVATSGSVGIGGFQIVEVVSDPGDTDADGLLDTWEDQYFGNNTPPATPAELALQNGNGDPDGDTFNNEAEETAGTDPTNAAFTPLDTDGDGLPDAWEILYFPGLGEGPGGDSDLDTYTNLQEFTAGSSPADPLSTPIDTDADTLLDSWELANFSNLGQNADGDPDNDLADNASEESAGTNPADRNSFPDSDADNLPDAWELFHFKVLSKLGTDDSDTDDGTTTGNPAPDGYNNRAEFLADSNPLDGRSTPIDVDADDLLDSWEIANFGNLASTGSQDPDGDVATNEEEEAAATNPNLRTSFPDFDTDGLPDAWELFYFTDLDEVASGDPDLDLATNLAEFRAWTNPADGSSKPAPPSISVNYDTVPSNTSALSPTDSAGVVPAAKWNNIASNGPGGFLNPTQTFVDNSATSTTLTVGVTSGGGDSWNTGGNADQKIYGDWINAGSGTTINLSGIPYASYDLYIYESHYNDNVATFTIGGDVQTLTNTDGPFGTPTHRLNDSYVKFTGLTASSVSVAVTAVSNQAGIAGFQIVEATGGGGNTFADWIANFPGVGASTGFGADPDGDGNDNGLENYLGTDPSQFSAGLTGISASGSSLKFRHTRSNTLATDVSTIYQWSTDMANWFASGQTNGQGASAAIANTVISDTSAPDNDVIEVTVTVTGGTPGRIFTRIKGTPVP
jgi:hypothetical protein